MDQLEVGSTGSTNGREQLTHIEKNKHNEEQMDGSSQAIYPADPLSRRGLKGHGSAMASPEAGSSRLANSLRRKSKQDKSTTDTDGSKKEQRVQNHKWHEGPQSPNPAGQDKSWGTASVGKTRSQPFRRPKVRQGLTFPKGPQEITLGSSESGSTSEQESKVPDRP